VYHRPPNEELQEEKKVMRGIKALLLGAAIVGVSTSYAVPALAANKSGAVRVWVTQSPTNSSPTDPILFTGAIGDYGTSTSQDKNGKADSNGAYQGVTLQQGSFVVDATKLGAKLNKSKPIINASTCSFSITASAPASIVSGSGTGAYKGLTGKILITASFAGYGPVKSGKCNSSQNAQPTSSYNSITGVGVVKFG
jgi:hypothetical protein